MKWTPDRSRALGALAGIGAGLEMAHPASELVERCGYFLIILFVVNYVCESVSFEQGHLETHFKERFFALWPTSVVLAALFAVSVATSAWLGIYEGRSEQNTVDEKIISETIKATEAKRVHLQGETDYRRLVIQGADGHGGLRKDIAVLTETISNPVTGYKAQLAAAIKAKVSKPTSVVANAPTSQPSCGKYEIDNSIIGGFPNMFNFPACKDVTMNNFRGFGPGYGQGVIVRDPAPPNTTPLTPAQMTELKREDAVFKSLRSKTEKARADAIKTENKNFVDVDFVNDTLREMHEDFRVFPSANGQGVIFYTMAWATPPHQ